MGIRTMIIQVHNFRIIIGMFLIPQALQPAPQIVLQLTPVFILTFTGA